MYYTFYFLASDVDVIIDKGRYCNPWVVNSTTQPPNCTEKYRAVRSCTELAVCGAGCTDLYGAVWSRSYIGSYYLLRPSKQVGRW